MKIPHVFFVCDGNVLGVTKGTLTKRLKVWVLSVILSRNNLNELDLRIEKMG